MSERKPAKKSETLEVRVEHEVKSALMHKARAEGRSASDVVRKSIESYLAEQPKEARSMLTTIWKPAAALSVGAAAIFWSALAPAPAAAGPDLRKAFERFDADKDGTVTAAEFRSGHADDRFIAHNKHGPGSVAPVMIPLHHNRPPPTAGGPVPPELLAQEFARQDADKSGSVSFAEFEAFHRQMMTAAFTNIDRDSDGGIDGAEFAAVTASMPKDAPVPTLAELDRNGDGKLVAEEFFAHHR